MNKYRLKWLESKKIIAIIRRVAFYSFTHCTGWANFNVSVGVLVDYGTKNERRILDVFLVTNSLMKIKIQYRLLFWSYKFNF